MIWVVSFTLAGGEREIQKNYWKEHSVGLSVEAMMLDSKAADLDKEERPEVYFDSPHLKLLSLLYRLRVSICLEMDQIEIT